MGSSAVISVPPCPTARMLDALGLGSIEELIDQTVPDDIRMTGPLDLPAPIGQKAAQDELRAIASANRPLTSLIGMGYHDTVTPPVIRRNIMENPAGTRRTPRISRRSHKAASKHSSTSRRWCRS